MKNKAIDFGKITKKYKGKWVALAENEKKVVSFGKSAKETFERAKKEGCKSPILFKVPDAVLPYVGGSSFLS